MWSDGLKDLATPLIDQSDNAWGSCVNSVNTKTFFFFIQKKSQAIKQ